MTAAKEVVTKAYIRYNNKNSRYMHPSFIVGRYGGEYEMKRDYKNKGLRLIKKRTKRNLTCDFQPFWSDSAVIVYTGSDFI